MHTKMPCVVLLDRKGAAQLTELAGQYLEALLSNSTAKPNPLMESNRAFALASLIVLLSERARKDIIKQTSKNNVGQGQHLEKLKKYEYDIFEKEKSKYGKVYSFLSTIDLRNTQSSVSESGLSVVEIDCMQTIENALQLKYPDHIMTKAELIFYQECARDAFLSIHELAKYVNANYDENCVDLVFGPLSNKALRDQGIYDFLLKLGINPW